MINLAATDTLQGNAQTNSTVTVTVSGMELVGTTETYKKLYQGQPSTSVAALYTVAASTTAFIRSIHVVNTAASTQTFALYVSGAVGTNRITPDLTLAANGFAVYSNDAWKTYNAQGNLLTTVPLATATPVVVDTTAGAAGTAALASASDHRHQLSTATNGLLLGTAASPGAASTTLRSNDTIAAFDATVPTTSAVGDAAATGSINFAARRDHAHGREAFGTPGSSALGDVAAAGSATTETRSDHKHGRESFATNTIALGSAAAAGVATTPFRSDDTIAAFDATVPTTSAAGDAAAVGSAAKAARRDHLHGREAFATPVAATSAALSSAGVATTIPRSDHSHQAAGGVAAIVATPATFAAVETVVDKFQFPANLFLAGTTIFVSAWGTVSATAAGTVLGRIRLGTNGTTADTQVAATAATGAAVAAVGWSLNGQLTIRTTGAGGTAIGNLSLAVSAGAGVNSAQTATVAVNTTVANFVDITLIGGGTAPVVTVINTLIEVVKL